MSEERYYDFDGIQVGETVVVHPHGCFPSYTAQVQRLTKTMIMVDHKRYRRANGTRVTGSRGYMGGIARIK